MSITHGGKEIVEPVESVGDGRKSKVETEKSKSETVKVILRQAANRNFRIQMRRHHTSQKLRPHEKEDSTDEEDRRGNKHPVVPAETPETSNVPECRRQQKESLQEPTNRKEPENDSDDAGEWHFSVWSKAEMGVAPRLYGCRLWEGSIF